MRSRYKCFKNTKQKSIVSLVQAKVRDSEIISHWVLTFQVFSMKTKLDASNTGIKKQIRSIP